MAKRNPTMQQQTPSRPFLTPEAQETYCVSLAFDLVQQRLKDGTASSQETVHFLKRGSEREKHEMERLQRENELLKAKTETLKSQQRTEELFAEAISAMRRYSGQGGRDDEY